MNTAAEHINGSEPEMVSLSSLEITLDNPTVKKWIGSGKVICSKWNKLGGHLNVLSKWKEEYQLLRAFYISGGKLVPADAIPAPHVSIDLRTETAEAMLGYLLTGERPEDLG